MLKATMKQDEDGPIRWEVGHNDQNHNQACLEQMNVSFILPFKVYITGPYLTHKSSTC